MRRTVEWTGDNVVEIERLLTDHVVRAEKAGDQCHIQGADELSLTLNLGDRIAVEGDRLGIFRKDAVRPDPEVTWTGTNVEEMARFLSGYEVRVELIADVLCIHDARGQEKVAIVNRGDKLIERGGMLIVSKAGKDHRA